MPGYVPQSVYDGAFGPATPPGGYPGFGGPGVTPVPGARAASRDDITERVPRSDARPTMIVRRQGNSRIPLAALAVVGAAGAVIGVWLAISSDSGAAPRTASPPSAAAARNPSQPPEGRPDPATSETSGAAAAGAPNGAAAPTEPGPAPTAVAAPSTDEPKQAPTAAVGTRVSGETPAAVAAPTQRADAPATGAAVPRPTDDNVAARPGDKDGAAEAPASVGLTEADDARDAKKRPGKVVQQDARVKAAKPKARPEIKRTEVKRGEARRGQKPESKEPSWNSDSPFLPEATPRR
jgi:hypothetical protein